MQQLIMWNLVTLDGFFEGSKPWELEWHNYVWGEELERLSLDQLKSVGMLLFGRLTYQGMADHWTTATGEIADLMNSIPKVVFSRTLEKAEWNNTRLVKSNAGAEVAALKQQAGGDLYNFGSANFSAFLMQLGLIDEYRLALTPRHPGRWESTLQTEPGADQAEAFGCQIIEVRRRHPALPTRDSAARVETAAET